MQIPTQSSTPAPSSPTPIPFPCFSSTDLEELKRIYPKQQKTYEPEKPICRYGDMPTDQSPACIFIVLAGAVEMDFTPPGEKGQELHTIGRGGFFGEVATLLHCERTATAKATDLTDLLILNAADLDDLLENHPRYARILMNGMAWRMRNSAIKMHTLALRRSDNEKKPEITPQDQKVHVVADFLGTSGFLVLFAVLFALWIAGHFWKDLDTNFTALALGLSVLQILISNLILNSQNRATKAEAPLQQKERTANFDTAKDVSNLHADLREHITFNVSKVSDDNAAILRRLERLEQQNQQNTQVNRLSS